MSIKQHMPAASAIWRQAMPQSLIWRMLFFTLISVVLAQLIASALWYSQTKHQNLQGLESTASSMAKHFASTANYFQSLPLQYRHIVLNQLRDIGGTRFFVSFNETLIDIDPAPSNQMRTTTQQVVKQELINSLDKRLDDEQVHVELSNPETLRVLNNSTYLNDLPKSWAHYTLTLDPLNPPILVVQMELATNEWLYIAALMPDPYSQLKDQVISKEQLFFIVAITAMLMLFTFLMVRKQIKPLKRLATAAHALRSDINQPPLKEEGAAELKSATQAFNLMQLAIKRHIGDRERLFGAISHDLKTPITRLRIRSELIEDEQRGIKFNKDLDELELMVKGALQIVKDTDIHENLTAVNLHELLHQIAEHHNIGRVKVFITGQPLPLFQCKPLAMKRCLTNLIDNGVRYGNQVSVVTELLDSQLRLTIQDEGNGIPEDKIEDVFKPYIRLAIDQEGHGLGLGIARSIVRAHGGELTIRNLPAGGLEVDIQLPFNPKPTKPSSQLTSESSDDHTDKI